MANERLARKGLAKEDKGKKRRRGEDERKGTEPEERDMLVVSSGLDNPKPGAKGKGERV